MSQFTVIEENPISLVDLKKNFASLQEEDMQLSFRAEKTKAYLDQFVLNDEKEYKALYEKVQALQIPRLKARHIVKVLDVMPKDLDSLRLLFSNETITLKEDDLKKILDVIPQ